MKKRQGEEKTVLVVHRSPCLLSLSLDPIAYTEAWAMWRPGPKPKPQATLHKKRGKEGIQGSEQLAMIT